MLIDPGWITQQVHSVEANTVKPVHDLKKKEEKTCLSLPIGCDLFEKPKIVCNQVLIGSYIIQPQR